MSLSALLRMGGYLYIGSDGPNDSDPLPHLYILEDLGTTWAYAPVPDPEIEFPDSRKVSSPAIDLDGDLYVVAGGMTDGLTHLNGRVCALRSDGIPKKTRSGKDFVVELDHPTMGLSALSIGENGVLYIGDSAAYEHNSADKDNIPHLFAIGERPNPMPMKVTNAIRLK